VPAWQACGACAPLPGRRLAACLPECGCKRSLRGARPLSHPKGTRQSGLPPLRQHSQGRQTTRQNQKIKVKIKVKVKVKIKIKVKIKVKIKGESQGQDLRGEDADGNRGG